MNNTESLIHDYATDDCPICGYHMGEFCGKCDRCGEVVCNGCTYESNGIYECVKCVELKEKRMGYKND